MKKLFAILLTAAVLTACNSNSGSSSGTDSSAGKGSAAKADSLPLRTDTVGPQSDSSGGKTK